MSFAKRSCGTLSAADSLICFISSEVDGVGSHAETPNEVANRDACRSDCAAVCLSHPQLPWSKVPFGNASFANSQQLGSWSSPSTDLRDQRSLS